MSLSPHHWPLFKLAPFALGLIALLSPRPSDGFDWEGKLQRELKVLRSPNAMSRRWAVMRLARFPKEQVAKHVLKALQDVNPTVQAAAAEVCARLRIPAATPVLARWLSHWDEQLRVAAARHLPALAGRDATQILLRSLVDPEPKVRRQVIESLGVLADRRAVLPIIARLEDPNIEVRTRSVRVLASFREKRAVIPLMARLSDASSAVRQAAATALGQLSDPRSAPAVTRLLRDPNATVVEAAIDTLGRLGYAGAVEPLIEVFQTRDTRYRESAARALAAIGTDLAIATLVRALSKSTLRSSAKSALSAATRQNPQHINRLLLDPRTPRHVALIAVEIARDARIRGAVPHLVEQLRLGRLPRLLLVDALGRIADPRALRPLLGLLSEKDHELKLAALHALESVLDARAAEPLLSCLQDASAEVRVLTIRYLGRLRSRVATPQLMQRARLAQPEEARQAIEALARIGDVRALPTLLHVLTHPDKRMRRVAVVAFGRLQDAKRHAGVLLSLCKRRGGSTRVSCIQALGGLLRGTSDPHALAFLDNTLGLDDVEVRLASLDALAAQQGPTIAPLLLKHLRQTRSPTLRARIVAVLGHHATSSREAATELVRQLHAQPGPTSAEAAWALSRVRPATATREIVRATRSSHWATRVNATAALSALRTSTQRATLKRLLDDKDPFVRANALLGLTWIGDSGAAARTRALVLSDQSPWVRINALRALLRVPSGPLILAGGRRFANARALAAELGRSDADPRVREIARDLVAPRAPQTRYRWIQLYLQDRQGKPLRDQPFVLVLPNGMIKAGRSDSRALLWEEQIPPGKIFLERPPRDLVAPDGPDGPT